jgi:hypothetical protein
MSQLREQFHSQCGITWINGQGEPDIEYVNWLEAKVEKLTASNKQSTPCCDVCGAMLNGDMECPARLSHINE